MADGDLRVLLDRRMDADGVGRYGRLLAQGLAELEDGPQVIVVERCRGWRGWLTTAPYMPWARRRVARTAAREAPDVVHNLSFEAPSVRTPLAVSVNDVIPLEHPASMPSAARRAAFRRMVRRTVHQADAVLVPSARTASALRLHVGTPSGRLVVVPLAVDPVFRPLPEGERVAARDRFAGGRPYVAAVGTGRSHKNQGLLRAVAPALFDRAGLGVVLRGPGPGGPGVTVVGPLTDDELRRLYGGAVAVLVCSHVEGYGYPAVEAAACGTPVVCGPEVGAREVLGDAVVVDVSDPPSVVEALLRILDEPGHARDLAVAGLAATAPLTPRAMAIATVVVYRQIAGR